MIIGKKLYYAEEHNVDDMIVELAKEIENNFTVVSICRKLEANDKNKTIWEINLRRADIIGNFNFD
jgi:hypothetical protein